MVTTPNNAPQLLVDNFHTHEHTKDFGDDKVASFKVRRVPLVQNAVQKDVSENDATITTGTIPFPSATPAVSTQKKKSFCSTFEDSTPKFCNDIPGCRCTKVADGGSRCADCEKGSAPILGTGGLLSKLF